MLVRGYGRYAVVVTVFCRTSVPVRPPSKHDGRKNSVSNHARAIKVRTERHRDEKAVGATDPAECTSLWPRHKGSPQGRISRGGSEKGSSCAYERQGSADPEMPWDSPRRMQTRAAESSLHINRSPINRPLQSYSIVAPVQHRTCLFVRRGGPTDAQFGRSFLADVLQELRRLEAPRPAPLLKHSPCNFNATAQFDVARFDRGENESRPCNVDKRRSACQ